MASGDRGRYGGVFAAILDDPDYLALSPPARLCLQTMKVSFRPAGIEILLPAVLAEQTGYTEDQVRAALDELAETDWIRTAPMPRSQRLVVWIRNGLKHEPFMKLTNKKHREGVEKHLRGLPRLAIVNEFAAYYELESPFGEDTQIREVDNSVDKVGITDPSERHAEGIRNGIPTGTDTGTGSYTEKPYKRSSTSGGKSNRARANGRGHKRRGASWKELLDPDDARRHHLEVVAQLHPRNPRWLDQLIADLADPWAGISELNQLGQELPGMDLDAAAQKRLVQDTLGQLPRAP